MARPRHTFDSPMVVRMLAPASVSVGTAVTDVLPPNVHRYFLFVRNVSGTAKVWLGLDGHVPAVDNGIELQPGDAVVFDKNAITLGRVRAIASAAATPVLVQEGISGYLLE